MASLVRVEIRAREDAQLQADGPPDVQAREELKAGDRVRVHGFCGTMTA